MKTATERPSAQEVESTVIRLAAAQGAVDPALVTLETRFYEDLNYDSLDMVEFVITLEETFDLTIPDDQSEQTRTVGAAAALIRTAVC